jgi:hypothetical protein
MTLQMIHALFPIIAAVIAAAIIFGTIVFLQYRGRRPNTHATFTPAQVLENPETGRHEPTGKLVDFDPRHQHYLKTAEVITTLASASLVFLLTLHLTRVAAPFAFAIVLLGITVVFSVLFMVFLTYFYENFLYSPDTYTFRKQAVLLGFGFSGLGCFALAYLVLSIQAAYAFGQGAISK